MRVFLVVDVQNDFLPGGALAVPEGDKIIPICNRLMDSFRLVVATQDWHPANHGSFATNHPGHSVGDVIDLNGLEQVLWPVHCVQGTWGSHFAPGLRTDRFARIFHKGTEPDVDSYSALFDNAHRKSTGLAEYLADHHVSDLFIAGLATDYCVKFTSLDARQLELNVHVVKDACRGVNLKAGDVSRALEEMRRAGVHVLDSSQVRSESQDIRA